ncbi:MAG: ATP-dependent Clp protease adaptor ClpS [Deltaproteobacteria bacterium]|nr:ATP-dependent Clp protease adaptor ClpS [Candidatus Anaeroferrophillus wilburensis]MBN2890121.1 ATP-dependent Clp protease adaptor ClpS [Deltaproteobacteria bacterium]
MTPPLHHLEEQIRSADRQQTDEPPLFRVFLHNDDYTTMDFVIDILENIFHKNSAEATRIMLQIHRQGIGACGEYPHSIAETKVTLVTKLAHEQGFPLQCSMQQV